MHWPQITMLILWGIALGIDLSKHGQLKTGKHNFWTSLIAVGVIGGVLAAGGFWGG